MKIRFAQAFTLLEILIVVAIAGIIALIAFGAFTSFNRTAAVNSAVQIAISALEEARTKTLASQNQSVYGVHFDTESVTVFVGNTYDPFSPDNRVRTFPTPVTVTNISLNGGGSDVVFKRLSGVTDQFGSIDLSSASSMVRTVTIDKTGIARES